MRFGLFVLLLLLAAVLLGGTLVACGGERAEHLERAAPELPKGDEVQAAFASAEPFAINAVIERMHAEPARYAPLLLGGLTHADRGVREWSAHAIGDLGLSGEETIDALMRAFDDADDWVRWKAVRALGRIGPAAQRALPLIEPVANAEQEVEVVRAAAKVAVKRIKGD